MNRSRYIPSRLRLTALGLALSVTAGIAGAQVFDRPDTDFRGSVQVAGSLVLPGSEVEIGGSGFTPGQSITLLRGETALNATPYVADAEGGFTATLQIPDDAVAGRHPVVVRVANPDAATVFDLKISNDIPLSGEDRFDIVSEKLVQGLYQVAYSPRNDALFVTAAVGRPPVTRSELLKLDPDTLEIVARITPAKVPGYDDDRVFAIYGVGLDDVNDNVWITNTRENTVAVYRQSDLSLVKQFELGRVAHSRDVIVDEARGKAYVSAATNDFISVFDARTLEFLQDIELRSGRRGEQFVPMSLALDAEAGKLFSVSLRTPEAVIIDTASDTVDKVFELGNAASASGVAWDAAAGRLLVASQGSDNLLIVDPETERVVHDVAVGAGALNVAVEPVSGLAFVSSRASGSVAVVDREGRLVANLDGGTFPNHVREDGKGRLFAVNKSRGADDPEGDRITRIVPRR